MVIYGFGVGVGTFVGLSLDGLIHEAADADRTDPDRRNAVRFRQARRRRRLRDAVVPNFGLDLNIEEIVAELVYPIAIGLDGEREGEGE